MKTTAQQLVGLIALAILSSTGTSLAGSWNSTSEVWLAAAALGQSNAASNPAEDAHSQATELLQRARQAMSENDFAAADSLIAKADALGVSYNALYMGDTPKKARRDLERKRNSASPAKPGQLLSFGSNRDKQAPTTDPFAGRTIGSPAADAANQQITLLPRVDSVSPLRSPAVQNNNANSNPLRAARVALAYGDVRRAAEMVQQAKTSGVVYQPLDDTPDKVEAAIRKHQETMTVEKNTEAYARLSARSMMEQADGLMRWGEFDEAERLASRAAAQRVSYGPFEEKPQTLLERIAVAKRQNGAAAAAPAAAMPSAPAGYATAASAPATSMASRQAAVQLVRQARQAIAAGQYNQAEAFARQAEQMRLPGSAFAPGEDRPESRVCWTCEQLQHAKHRRQASCPPALPKSFRLRDRHARSKRLTQAVYNPANDPTQERAKLRTMAPTANVDLRLALNQESVSPQQSPDVGQSLSAGPGTKRRFRPNRKRPARRRSNPAWLCSSRAKRPCGPMTPTGPTNCSVRPPRIPTTWTP